MEDVKEEIIKMIDNKAIVFTLPDSAGYVIYTDDFYRDKYSLYQILTQSKDSTLNKLIWKDEKTLKKMLLIAEMDAIKQRLSQLENEMETSK